MARKLRAANPGAPTSRAGTSLFDLLAGHCVARVREAIGQAAPGGWRGLIAAASGSRAGGGRAAARRLRSGRVGGGAADARQTPPRLLDARSPRTTHLVLSMPTAVEFLQPSAVEARRPRKECVPRRVEVAPQPEPRQSLFNNREAGGRTSVRSPGFPEARCPEPSTHGMAVSLGVCAEPAGGRGWPGPTNRRMHGAPVTRSSP